MDRASRAVKGLPCGVTGAGGGETAGADDDSDVAVMGDGEINVG